MASTPELERFVLVGSPAEMGEQHGEQLAPLIAELAEIRINLIGRLTASSISVIQLESERIADATRALLPDVWSESVAVAASAGLPYWKLMVAGAFSDVLDRCGASGGDRASECTLRSVSEPGGRSLIVGTWDTHGSASPFLVLLERRPVSGPATLALSTAGWPMQQGITANGLGFAIANMASSRQSAGTSYICALPHIAATASGPAAAVSSARAIPLCSARYYLFAGSNSRGIGLETDGAEFESSDGDVVHTNHFLMPGGRMREGRPDVVEESEGRRLEMEELRLGAADSPAEALERLAQLGPKVIKRGTGDDDRTCATYALFPDARIIWYSVGTGLDAQAFTAELDR